jgi:hypothetical protein
VNDSHTPYTTWVPDVCLMVASGQTKRIWEHTAWARSAGLLDLLIKLLVGTLEGEMFIWVCPCRRPVGCRLLSISVIILSNGNGHQMEKGPYGYLISSSMLGTFVPSCKGEAYALPELSGCTWSRDPII